MGDWTCLPAKLRVLEEGENPAGGSDGLRGEVSPGEANVFRPGENRFVLKRVKIGQLALDSEFANRRGSKAFSPRTAGGFFPDARFSGGQKSRISQEKSPQDHSCGLFVFKRAIEQA